MLDKYISIISNVSRIVSGAASGPPYWIDTWRHRHKYINRKISWKISLIRFLAQKKNNISMYSLWIRTKMLVQSILLSYVGHVEWSRADSVGWSALVPADAARWDGVAANSLVDGKDYTHINSNISTLDHYELHCGFNFVRWEVKHTFIYDTF